MLKSHAGQALLQQRAVLGDPFRDRGEMEMLAGLVVKVASKAMPIEPPRLRVMLNRLDELGILAGASPARGGGSWSGGGR